jgi:hypothetical protein
MHCITQLTAAFYMHTRKLCAAACQARGQRNDGRAIEEGSGSLVRKIMYFTPETLHKYNLFPNSEAAWNILVCDLIEVASKNLSVLPYEGESIGQNFKWKVNQKNRHGHPTIWRSKK